MSSFNAILNGPLQGVLTWENWETLINTLKATQGEGWYVYFVGTGVPDDRLQGENFGHVMSEIDQLLRRDHEERYFGIAYVDDFETPSLVKIYDPNNLGSSCGSSGMFIPPGWVISKMPPEEIRSHQITPQGRKRWWHALIGR